ncbi:flavodoxin family protein [Clostridium cellulovorans]|uniref:NADPH-dependent FMN reductase n=1 Tax=Clostridium cellulovorans (strain ATCC 35296 / DSM 3052 / OCM 3 / 743B) TaxID=573061 RepID=D9SNA8_CLOC7|nr:flavodoxin family protein [Clostridium cellulovorans]ADL53900.1 NADPH-dependent FMN reductase [Clostridium cellulovorans 743B]
MKTLIFNGSPRKNGDTQAMINEFRKHINGEVKIIDAYYANIKPCTDCRYCHHSEGCSKKDDMQEVYDYILECDNIIIASPLYFSELSGQLLAVMSRLQTYWCARFFRYVNPIEKKKKGGILLAGGGDGHMEKAIETAECLLHKMNAVSVGAVCSHNTENVSPKEDRNAIENIKKIAMQLNYDYINKTIKR